jgi:D-lactate dehydrogenase (cytochrome)
VTLARLAEELGRHAPPLYLPPNPTETTAQVGGSVAANASGGRSYRWGPIRRYVAALRVALASGDVLALRRGECLAGPEGFEVELSGGAVLRVPVPSYRMPAVKSAAGYHAAPGMDLVDLFVGSEGTLGVITEATLAVEPAPDSIISILGFFPDEARALAFVRAVRGAEAPAGVQAIEYFDGGSLQLLAEKRAGDGAESEVPETPAGAGAAVLVEVAGSEAETEAALERLAELLEAHGADSGQAWAGLEARERQRLAAFRHALPEAVNSLIGRTKLQHPGLTKVGTDMAVPPEALGEMLAAYRRALDGAGLRYVLFGHIGDDHLHANVLPRDMAEYRRARALYLELARLAVRLGGTVSAEHGIGKLKKQFLELMYGPEGIEQMRRVKRALDPQCLLGRGTMFDC